MSSTEAPHIEWIIPQRGIRGVVYHYFGPKKLFELTGWQWILALFPLSDKELEGLLSAELNEVTTHNEAVAITLNQKGGPGKSSVAICLAEMIARKTQQAVLAVDGNQANGSTASRIGAHGTLTGRQCLDTYKELVESGKTLTRALLDRLLERHPMPGYGSLRVVRSNTDKENRTPSSYNDNLTLYRALRECTHSLVFDGGNSLSAHASIMNAAIELSDVLIFVARPAQEDSVVDCLETMVHYMNVHPEKVARSIVVIVAHKKGEPGAEYYADMFGVSEQRVVVVPFDPFFSPPKVRALDDPTDPAQLETLNRVTAVHLLRRKTRIAYLKLALLVYEQAAPAKAPQVQDYKATEVAQPTPQIGDPESVAIQETAPVAIKGTTPAVVQDAELVPVVELRTSNGHYPGGHVFMEPPATVDTEVEVLAGEDTLEQVANRHYFDNKGTREEIERGAQMLFDANRQFLDDIRDNFFPGDPLKAPELPTADHFN